MFSTANVPTDQVMYDFASEYNWPKWQGLLVMALQKVQHQVHLSLTAKDDALTYIEGLILRLLGILCSSQPHVVADVEERVQRTFPHPIDKWAIKDALSELEKGRKKSTLVLPVEKIHPLLVKEVLGYKVDYQVTLYIVAVLEYIAADILKLTGNYVKNIKHTDITLQDIKVAMCADKVLMDMFFHDDEDEMTVSEEQNYVRRQSLTYEDLVKDLILEETQYMRDLNMIIKVFRSHFARLFAGSKDLDVIFSNIIDIQEMTANLLGSLEDTIEVTDDNSVPTVGACFEELMEGAEFDVYERYAEDMLKPNGRERLNTLLQRNDTSLTFQSAGHLFKDAVKYVLPKLVLGPIYHCLHYIDVINALLAVATDDRDDRDCLDQALSVLVHLKTEIERKLQSSNLSIHKRKPGGISLRFRGLAEREKMNDLQKNIDCWEGKDISRSCNEYIMEGVLYKYLGRRLPERYVFLFDGLIIFTKQNMRRSSVTGPVGEYKLKEKYSMRRVDIVDREDTEDMKYCFELQPRDHPSMTLMCKTAEEKNNWMAALVSLLTRSMLERMLDGILSEEEKKTPLGEPSPETYRFAEQDSAENIVLEDGVDTDIPVIKGGTLVKLVERLTYHTYADPQFLRTFLTTYRTFCKPSELLDLLIERFNIPDPPDPRPPDEMGTDASLVMRDYLKRFRKEYSKPVQLRVLNVLRHWIEHHWYDFEWNVELREKLQSFLESAKSKPVKKCMESISKMIARRLESDGQEKQKQITYSETPPQIEWHLTRKYEEFDLMMLHPIEIARQVTLLEFDLYRAVKPSELVGSVWMKKHKNTTSPNLLKMIQHSTRFTFWLEKCILEAENFEERVAVFSRILEVMLVFQELNNFNGVLEVVSAFNSAPVHRLEHTFTEVDTKYHRLMKAFDEAKELNSNHFKMYIEKLRSINPPCVPFLGMYLTNILLTEEGNPNFLPNRPEGIINFSKRRKIAEITGEIQQYQHQPYCLKVEGDIRMYFEKLDPLGDMTEKEFNDYLFSKSLELEPRNSKQSAKCEKKRDYSLKSPGIKPMSQRHSSFTPGRERSHLSSISSSSIAPTQGRAGGLGMEDIGNAGDMQLSSGGTTPPTPSTPHSPNIDTGVDGVFMPSNFTDTGSTAGISIASSISTITSASFLDHDDIPPPIPPRPPRRRESSNPELSPVRLVPEPPSLPPRNAPPLPPRRDTGPVTPMTLPRPVPQLNPVPPPPQSRTLPRSSAPCSPYSPSPTVNGDRSGSVTPELPPKTYRTASVSAASIHIRKHSTDNT